MTLIRVVKSDTPIGESEVEYTDITPMRSQKNGFEISQNGTLRIVLRKISYLYAGFW